ncbi:MAG: lysozyme inhibitor LprI family protein [Pseudomonadota bacterium]|nr:lysozyme inhibitor LprI family protein [Pseudomonadota bacterium]
MLVAVLMLMQGAPLDCADPYTQMAMNRCAVLEFQESDAELNAQWKLTAAEMKRRDADRIDDGRPGYFETLLAAQRAWIAYRDTHCTAEGYYARGGSMESLLVSTCMTDLTKQRTRDLRDLITQ